MVACHIRTDDRRYWQATNGGGDAVHAGGPWPRDWETFNIEPCRGGVLGAGVAVWVTTYNGMRVFVADDGSLSAAAWPAQPSEPAALDVWRQRRQALETRSTFTLELEPVDGATLEHLGRFALRAFDGRYVCAENGGGVALVANRGARGPWETFVVDCHPEPVGYRLAVSLRCTDGAHFVRAVGGGGGRLDTLATAVGAWEQFELVAADRSAAGFRSGAPVHVRTPSLHYLQAANGGGATVSAQGPWPREWETFTLVLPAGESNLVAGGTFSLMTSGRTFVSAVAGQIDVTASATRLGAAELFVNTVAFDVRTPSIEGHQSGVTVAIVTGSSGYSTTQEGSTTESRIGDVVCTSTPMTISEQFDEALLLDPVSDVLWPGAVIDGTRWVNGEYRAITDPRAPLALSLSLESLTGASVSTTVASPSLQTMREALNGLRGGLVGTPLPAALQHEIVDVHSAEQMQLALGVGVNAGLHKLTSKFDFSSATTTNKYLWRFQQRYYTADVSAPSRGEEFFASPRTPAAAEMYISSVTYGRMLVFAIESCESKTTMQAAMDYAYQAVGKANFTVNARYENALTSSKINVLVLGGRSDLAEAVVTGGRPAIAAYIESGKTFGPDTPAVPLAYRLRFLTDNALGNLLLTTSFTRRSWAPAVARYRLDQLKITCQRESDPGPEIELYGRIWVRGGISGITEHVPITTGELVWDRPKKRPLDLGAGQSFPIGQVPTLTFEGVHKYFDNCFIELTGNLWEYDDLSGNDAIVAGPTRIQLNQIQPGHPSFLTAEFAGDGNRVNVTCMVTPIQTAAATSATSPTTTSRDLLRR